MNALALLIGDERRRGFFHQLLVAALQRAVAGADHHHVAVAIGDHLGFDVARAVEELLDEAFAAPEGGFGFTNRRGIQFGHFVHAPGDLHAASAAAECGLDGDRQAMLFGEGQHLGGALHRAGRAGHQGRADLLGELASFDLVAKHIDGFRVRADPDQPGALYGAGEVGTLGEKAVAGVHGIGTGALGDGQQLVDVQVGVGQALAVQPIGFVGLAHMQGVDIGIGVHGHGGYTVITAGAGDTHGDFTTVGDQDFFHGWFFASAVRWEASGSSSANASIGLKRICALIGICPARSKWWLATAAITG